MDSHEKNGPLPDGFCNSLPLKVLDPKGAVIGSSALVVYDSGKVTEQELDEDIIQDGVGKGVSHEDKFRGEDVENPNEQSLNQNNYDFMEPEVILNEVEHIQDILVEEEMHVSENVIEDSFVEKIIKFASQFDEGEHVNSATGYRSTGNQFGVSGADFVEVETIRSNENSEDSEYTPSLQDDSDNDSWLYSDIEGPEDDDIFEDKYEGLSMKEKYELLKNLLKESRKKNKEQKDDSNEDRIEQNEWYTDEEEEELTNLVDEDGNEEINFTEFHDDIDMSKFHFKKGMLFRDVLQFRKTLKNYAVRRGFMINFLANDKTKVTATCKAGCSWRLHASPIQNSMTFQVKTLRGNHVCSHLFENCHATYKYLGKRLVPYMKKHPSDNTVKVMDVIYQKFELIVSKDTAYRARREALKIIDGDEVEQYTLLWDYCETVRHFNPGSVLGIKVNSDLPSRPMFDSMFFCLHALSEGFMKGCRTLIGLDGCFLKHAIGGQLLAAVGRDGNNNMFTIAIAVVPIERRDTWSWFLDCLHRCIGDPNKMGYSYISDRQKGLLDVFRDEYPKVHHRFCLRHMYANFKKKFNELGLKELFWRAASVANKREHQKTMKMIKDAQKKVGDNETPFEWLRKIPREQWARAYFPTHSKCDALTNNISESFNNYILDTRDKPIITMLEMIMGKLMSRLQVKREGMSTYEGSICPNIMTRIAKLKDFSKGWIPTFAGNGIFAVINGTHKHVVNLLNMECSCGMFQLTGYPCSHALACIYKYRKVVEDYIHPCYHKVTYMKAYEHVIHPVPGPHDYIQTNLQPFGPPLVKKKAGRPKKMRRKGIDEGGRETKPQEVSTRKGLKITCMNCLQTGHNRSKCNNPTHPNSKLNKVPNDTESVDPRVVPDAHVDSSVVDDASVVPSGVGLGRGITSAFGMGRGSRGSSGFRRGCGGASGVGKGNRGASGTGKGKGDDYTILGGPPPPIGTTSAMFDGERSQVVREGVSDEEVPPPVGRFYDSFRNAKLTSQLGADDETLAAKLKRLKHMHKKRKLWKL